jgi:phosphoribosylaminoimidazolecarboxamide formyltransferase / IMP cyclohydrolase
MKNRVDKIDDLVKVRHVLISVSDKNGLDTFIPALLKTCRGVKIFSTGGTYNKIKEILGKKAEKRLIQVSDYTGQPETQGGLVKTLDFKIYLGILTETYNKFHKNDLKRTAGVPIDMVIVNLYPFEATVANEDETVEDARANIDIGGPCMVRASAKNYLRVASVVNPKDYKKIINELEKTGGKTSLKLRYELAKKSFDHTAGYDRAISDYLLTKPYSKMKNTYKDIR